eukprot:6468212-Amphidinium_carterae.1
MLGQAVVDDDADKERDESTTLELDPMAFRRQRERENRRAALEFLSSPSALTALTIVRTALAPEIGLMRKYLHSNEPCHDHHNFQGTASDNRLRNHYISCMEDSGDFSTALAETASSLQDNELWASLCNHTEETSSTILRTLLRAAAVLYQNVIHRCRKYPYKVFAAAASMSLAEEVLADAAAHPCTLDAFSLDFATSYDSLATMTGPDAKLYLSTVALHAKGNTYTTERMHSKN